MRTIYININDEQIQSNDELEVLKHDLDGDFFFYLGEKIAKGCNIENENALITEFNVQDNKEDFQQIISQWNDIKAILFSEECEGRFEFTLPKGYIHWLKFHQQYVAIYDKNFSNGEARVLSIDLEELYEDSVEELQRKILRRLKKNDLCLEIDEIVFNDDTVTRKSPIIRAIKEKYDGIGFEAYKKWLLENEERPTVCEKCKKNPCECNINPIPSDNFFPYKGISLGETQLEKIGDKDLRENGPRVFYNVDDKVCFMGIKGKNNFIAAASMNVSPEKFPNEWANLLGFRFGALYEKCCRALTKKDFDIIDKDDNQIIAVTPSKRYLLFLSFYKGSSLTGINLMLNKCPYCESNSFALRKDDMLFPYCTDCNMPYLPDLEEAAETGEEYVETPHCPNCSSDDVENDGSDYMEYTCNNCGHNWGHDDTVECPECGSNDVENDGTDNLPYECNECGYIWGDEDEVEDEVDCQAEDYDNDTDNTGNQMSEYLEAFGVILGKSTKCDLEKLGGEPWNDNPNRYWMPNRFNCRLKDDIVCEIEFLEESIPVFYRNFGLCSKMNRERFDTLFRNLGFRVASTEYYSLAYGYCKKYDTSFSIMLDPDLLLVRLRLD